MDDADGEPPESLPSVDMQPPPALHRPLGRLRRAVLARRRPLAAALAALAVLAGIRATTAPPPPTTPVVVARADLPGGTPVRSDDLVTVDVDPDLVPSGASSSPARLVGRVLAAPVRAGEPLTDVRLVAPGLLDGYPGLVAAPVRVADADVVRLLDVGDRVDVLAADPTGRAPAEVVAHAPVVALPSSAGHEAASSVGGLVVVAVAEGDALELAARAPTHVLSVVLVR